MLCASLRVLPLCTTILCSSSQVRGRLSVSQCSCLIGCVFLFWFFCRKFKQAVRKTKLNAKNVVTETVIRTLRIAGLKLCANFRRELRSCWKPWSSGGEAWWSPAGPLVPADTDPVGPAPCCCRRHTLVLITSNRSHKSNWTTCREKDKMRTEMEDKPQDSKTTD